MGSRPSPLRPPRRIFRGSDTARPGLAASVSRTIAVGVVGVIVGAAAVLLWRPPDLFGRESSEDTTLTADAPSVSIVDGDTLLLHRTVVHLRGVTAPERGTTCRAKGGDTVDCGVAAADALANLVSGRDVVCRIESRDRNGLAEGLCDAEGSPLNAAVVAAGWARGEGELAPAEDQARAAARGLWVGQPR